jgi:predicted nucleic acid-binding protein
VTSVYEVFKVVHRQRGEGDAIMAVALMQQGSVVDLSIHLALQASRESIALGLSMAGSMILATARARSATLWTQDADFATVEGVRYVERCGSE